MPASAWGDIIVCEQLHVGTGSIALVSLDPQCGTAVPGLISA
jgi:hypothetical protein